MTNSADALDHHHGVAVGREPDSRQAARPPQGETARPRNLLTVDACERLGHQDAADLYREFVSPAAAKVLASFSFGRDLFRRAAGTHLETVDGRLILDFTGGFGVLNHGHNHPRILEVRQKFGAAERMEVHKTVFSPYLAGLSHNLAKLLPGDLNKSFMCNSGAEAVEGAIKLAFRNRPKRRYLLHSDISFHGKLIASGGISSGSRRRGLHLFPRMRGTREFRYNDFASVRSTVDELGAGKEPCDVYAVIVEPFNASNLKAVDRHFITDLRKFCDDLGAILIFDEVYTGFGKTGSMFYFESLDVVPDILCLSKSFGGGKASISAYVARDQVFAKGYGSVGDAFLHSSTYNGFGEECATAIEAINIAVDEDFPAQAQRISDALGNGLRALQEKYPSQVRDVRGVGALYGIVLSSPVDLVRRVAEALPGRLLASQLELAEKITPAAVADELYAKHGILCALSQNSDKPMLMCTPSLIIDDTDIDRFLEALEACLAHGLGKLATAFTANRIAKLFS